MSKPLRLASLVVICGLCVAVAVQTRSNSSLRAQILSEAGRTSAAEEALRRGQEEMARLKERNDAYKAESEALRKKLADLRAGAPVAAGETASAAAPSPSAPPAEAAVAPGGNAKTDFAKAMAKMFSDPEMKKMMRTQQGMAIRSMYADLAKQLGLTAEEAGPLMNLLAERQMDLTEHGLAMMNGADGTDPAAAGEALADFKSKYEAQIRAALGDRYPAFQEYEKALPDRMVLQQYQQQFSDAGQSLSDDQRAGLLRIMSEERAAMPPNEFSSANADPAAQMRALASDEKMHELFASQEEFNRRVLARAGTVLSDDQVAAFTDMQGRMLQLQQAGVKMSRNMFSTKK